MASTYDRSNGTTGHNASRISRTGGRSPAVFVGRDWAPGCVKCGEETPCDCIGCSRCEGPSGGGITRENALAARAELRKTQATRLQRALKGGKP